VPVYRVYLELFKLEASAWAFVIYIYFFRLLTVWTN